MNVAVRIPVVESSQPGEARRVSMGMARKAGFDATLAGKVAIVVTEVATNLVKHGGGGEILLQTLQQGPAAGLEVIAIDRGRGMVDVGRSLRDGESTSGTNGSGLGAMVRLSNFHDLYSRAGHGTAILARFWASAQPVTDTPIEVEGFSVPMPGEEVCGDAWAVQHTPDGCRILVIDGLGHGIAAAEAAWQAIAEFRENRPCTCVEQMEAIHARLRSSRGAAGALAAIDTAAGVLRFTGIGNIAGVISAGGQNRNLVSMSGTLGHNVRVIREFSYPWPAAATLVMHSDGVSGRWDWSSYPGLLQRTPALTGAVLYRDMGRGKDDATVVIARATGVSP